MIKRYPRCSVRQHGGRWHASIHGVDPRHVELITSTPLFEVALAAAERNATIIRWLASKSLHERDTLYELVPLLEAGRTEESEAAWR